MIGLGLAIGACASSTAPASAGFVKIQMVDDEYAAEVIRIPVGGTVNWTSAGTNPHNVVASDGTWRSETTMVEGDSFERTFSEPGAVAFFCTFHGTAEGAGMAGWVLVGDDAGVPESRAREAPTPDASGAVLSVPADFPTIQEAVDGAEPGDLILVAAGVYREAVLVTTPSLTIRGLDRNAVILDGGFELIHGVQVLGADGVVVENLTARNFLVNGVYWNDVTGYRGSYLTAHNNGDYGIYAFDSTDGLLEKSYASGNVDSGFYIGQCFPCNAVITEVISENNALGYSGTNAGGDLYLINSVWRNNMGGIVPNSLDSELNPPHRSHIIVGNLIENNDNLEAPTKGFARLALGIGVVLGGGVGDVVERNLIINHSRFGVAATALSDRNLWWSQDAVVRGNRIVGSGHADLALVGPWGPGNCFEDNNAVRTVPPLLEVFHGCDGLRLPLQADTAGLAMLLGVFADGEHGYPPGGDYQLFPPPGPQPSMPDAATAPAAPAFNVFFKPDIAAIMVPFLDPTIPIDSPEVAVSIVPVSQPTFWTLIFTLYAYVLPLVLYAAWVTIALWDLVRREERRWLTVGWTAVILLVPFVGVIGYFALGGSPIPRWFRMVLVGGGALAYLIVLGIAAVLGGVV